MLFTDKYPKLQDSNELTDRVSMIESVLADRITELEKVVIELEDRIRKLEWSNRNEIR